MCSAATEEDMPARFAPGQHFPALDGLRGIAVLMVILAHFTAYGFPHEPSRLLTAVASIGGTGVDLFFVLSGFLITRILLDTKCRPGCLKVFYVRRILRIFPLYYGFLVLIWLLVPLLRIGPWVPFNSEV